MILTGAIPSAKDGLVVVETTWRGGRGGQLWDIVKKALETLLGAFDILSLDDASLSRRRNWVPSSMRAGEHS